MPGLPLRSRLLLSIDWQVYYWCEGTDEVLWEPPAGATPRTDAERDTAAEAAALPAAATLPVDDAAASHAEPAADSSDIATAAGTQRAAASDLLPAAASHAEASPAGPSQAQRVAEQLSARLRQAAGAVFAGASKLVWLAVEAEVRARDLAALGAAHGPRTGPASLPEQAAPGASSAQLDRPATLALLTRGLAHGPDPLAPLLRSAFWRDVWDMVSQILLRDHQKSCRTSC